MDNVTQAQEWQRLAAMDLKSAKHLLNMHPVPIEIVCYLCQQSAEKHLKGLAYGVQPRYPMGATLEEQDMRQALRSAEVVQGLALSLAPEMDAEARY